jgi:hypothetical protein|eukprot:COSAG01_NODE_3559_length_5935_cov_2.330535_2_plen_60_part_00
MSDTVLRPAPHYADADIVNVRDCGAVGDGEHDDSHVLQAALFVSRSLGCSCVRTLIASR